MMTAKTAIEQASEAIEEPSIAFSLWHTSGFARQVSERATPMAFQTSFVLKLNVASRWQFQVGEIRTISKGIVADRLQTLL